MKEASISIPLYINDIEFAATVQLAYEPLIPGVINKAPEDCYPDEGGDIELLSLFAYMGGKKVNLSWMLRVEEIHESILSAIDIAELEKDEPDYDDYMDYA